MIVNINGKRYRKLDRDEEIKEGAMMTFNGSKLMSIKNTDGKTIGHTPSYFSSRRDFFNPI